MLAVKSTVYPDGTVNEYQNGTIIKINSAPNTKEFNKWINFIHKKR
jgi:hypothetical protein